MKESKSPSLIGRIYDPKKSLNDYKEDLDILRNEFDTVRTELITIEGDWFTSKFIGAYVASGISFLLIIGVISGNATMISRDLPFQLLPFQLFQLALPVGIAAALIPLIVVVSHNNLKLQQKNAELSVTYSVMRNLKNYIASLEASEK